jgi:hypothetical protein
MLFQKNFKTASLPFLLVVGMLGFACSSSKTEEQAMQEVAQGWGSVTNISKGVFSNSGGGSGKYFEIEITNPQLFTEESDQTLNVGGIALTLYKNFSKEERERYTRYDIVLKDTSGHETTFSTPVDQAKLFFEQEKQAVVYINKLLKGDFEFLNEHYIPIKQIGPDSLKLKFDPLLQAVDKSGKPEVYTVKQEEEELPDGSKIEVITYQGIFSKKNDDFLFMIMLEPRKKDHNLVRIGYVQRSI